MKRALIVLLLIFLMANVSAVTIVKAPHYLNRTASLFLAGFGAVALIAGLTGLLLSKGPQRTFFMLTLGWGAVNMGIVLYGWVSHNIDKSSINVAKAVEQWINAEKSYLVETDAEQLSASLADSFGQEPAPDRKMNYSVVMSKGGLLVLYDMASCFVTNTSKPVLLYKMRRR
jgi:hypothetical protein